MFSIISLRKCHYRKRVRVALAVTRVQPTLFSFIQKNPCSCYHSLITAVALGATGLVNAVQEVRWFALSLLLE